MAAGNQPLDHAIVVGGSLAGLLTARVLSDHARHVTILERDPVHDHPESRKGQPQTRHIHGLLAAGQQAMQHYFPDLVDALAAGGAFVGDMGQTMNWYTHGGYRKPFPSGIIATTVSRPFLEYLLRQRVRALPNVTLRDNSAVRRLLTTPDHTRVTGVLVERRDGTAGPEALHAGLVVDCSGRGSRTPAWLADLGYPAPPLTEVRVDVGYASRTYHRDPADPRGMHWYLVTPEAPRENRFAGLFPIDGERWILSMGGWGGDYPPTGEAGFLAYARGYPAPDIHDIISRAEPLTPIVAHKYPGSVRRHYEQLDRFPAGFLVLGDAISSFNPTYGQGMSSAALQARALDRVLRDQTAAPALAPAYFRAAAQVVDTPWQLAVGEDFRFPTTQGDKPPGTDFINRYVSRVHRASHHDPVTGLAFLRVMNLLAPPTSLFHPRYLWRVLRYSRVPTPPNHPARPIARIPTTST